MVFNVEYERTVPARRPEGHQPAAPRHGLRWTKPIVAIVADYFALQAEELSRDEQLGFFERARMSFESEADGPDCHEIMRSRDEAGYTNAIVVAYWTDPVRHARWSLASTLVRWFRDEARLSERTGTWRETTSVPYDRHETIYSESWYRIGIGRTDSAKTVPITTNGYFGAARDRVPLSAIDTLESAFGTTLPHGQKPISKGRRLLVPVPLNMVTLRSGQYWAHAEGEQLADYTANMRPRLMAGMDHLVAHKQETGTISLHVMTNLDPDGSPRRETSVYAHFLTLDGLEEWAAGHKTHLDIYRHAIAMNRHHKEKRQFVSWHEMFVHHSAAFEYANCHSRTGLLPYFDNVCVEHTAS